MLCAGIGFGTYRQGFHAGRNYKEPSPKPPFGYASVYYVEDLLATGSYQDTVSGLDDIRQQITAKVVPASWKENGGNAQIRAWEANSSFVVMQDQSGHEQVASYLKSLRENAPKSETNVP
jgi:hypothetical protein